MTLLVTWRYRSEDRQRKNGGMVTWKQESGNVQWCGVLGVEGDWWRCIEGSVYMKTWMDKQDISTNTLVQKDRQVGVLGSWRRQLLKVFRSAGGDKSFG